MRTGPATQIIVAIKVGDLGILHQDCGQLYGYPFFIGGQWSFQSLGISVFWVKNESVWSVMTTCNGI